MTVLTIDDFRRRARLANMDVLEHETGDYLFNPGLEKWIKSNAMREAAVMIGVRETGAGIQVLLTERTHNLRSHSGQVAFPGGRADPEDATVECTAVRETEEETGIAADNIEIVGRLPIYFTGSGYRIHPILGIISGEYELVPNVDEVASIFDVPLSFLMDEQNHQTGSGDWKGRTRYFLEMPYGERYIWGVTAGILRVMYERLYR